MKLSKIKLLDLISNAPRSNKKKYIKGNNSGGAIKINSIEDVDANNYEPGTIVVDKYGVRYQSYCEVWLDEWVELDEYLETPEFKSNFDSTFVVDGVTYRRWEAYQTQSYEEGQKHHDIIITREDVFINQVDMESSDIQMINPYVRAIAAGDYNATLEDESSLDYKTANGADRMIIAYKINEGCFEAYTIKGAYVGCGFGPFIPVRLSYSGGHKVSAFMYAYDAEAFKDGFDHVRLTSPVISYEDLDNLPDIDSLLTDYTFTLSTVKKTIYCYNLARSSFESNDYDNVWSVDIEDVESKDVSAKKIIKKWRVLS